MSIPYLAQPQDKQQFEWIGGSVLSVLLDAEAAGGQLTVGRFDLSKGEAPPFHVHNNDDEVFLLPVRFGAGVGRRREARVTGGRHRLPARAHSAWRPHHFREADLLLISTPGGLEKMFRHAGRDLREPRPEGFEIPAQLLAEAAELSGNVVLGPPR